MTLFNQTHGDTMAAISFDTLKFANRLKLAGVAPSHAEVEAEVFETNLSELATKSDLQRLEQVTKTDFQHLEEATKAGLQRLEQITKSELQRLEERFENRLMLLEQRMTIKLGGLMVIAVGAVAALVKLL